MREGGREEEMEGRKNEGRKGAEREERKKRGGRR